jgi:hypothetical protein
MPSARRTGREDVGDALEGTTVDELFERIGEFSLPA